ncbi:MAG: dihydrodipicolinate synthase family protein [Candidatus Hydrogenedentes bacterium]|nr:dihydrodipicolinate synthase family protein [Candidatus Hydrogenedentota bacterium]
MTTSFNTPRVIAAMLTPCSQPGQPDLDELGRFAQALVEKGCDGLFICSSTGELPLLGRADRRAMISTVKQAVGNRAAVYAGISAMGVADVIACAREAAESGADVGVAMVPFFCKLAPREVEAYFTEIADASPIPVALYHHVRMPSEIDLETVASLRKHPNIVAIKDTARDVTRIGTLAKAGADGWDVYQGSESIILDSLECGATGCVSALANVAPDWHRELVESWLRGDCAAAEAAQKKINALGEMFSFEAVGRSFDNFAHSIRRAATRRGFLSAKHGMITGGEACPEFERQLDKHFERIGLA